jgi:hypothetical protein
MRRCNALGIFWHHGHNARIESQAALVSQVVQNLIVTPRLSRRQCDIEILSEIHGIFIDLRNSATTLWMHGLLCLSLPSKPPPFCFAHHCLPLARRDIRIYARHRLVAVLALEKRACDDKHIFFLGGLLKSERLAAD